MNHHNSRSNPLHLRVLFTLPEQFAHLTSSIDLFDANSERLGRLEFAFLSNYLQISLDGFQTPWLPLSSSSLNALEIKDLSAIKADIKLNGKRIVPSAFIPEYKAAAFKITYMDDIVNPSITGDSDWIDLTQDQEIYSLLLEPIQWQAPVKSIAPIISQKVEDEARRHGELDSIVFDESLSIQIASGQSLPKLPLNPQKILKPMAKSFSILSIFQSPNLHSSQYNLPVPLLHSKHAQKSQTFWIVVLAAFAIYLGVLVQLSQMTSVRQVAKPVSAEKAQFPSTSPLSLSNSSASIPAAVSKSPSRTLTVSFPGPLIPAAAVLKVSVPAAFSLADNRHIIFPSKLRNFQK